MILDVSSMDISRSGIALLEEGLEGEVWRTDKFHTLNEMEARDEVCF